MEEKREAYVYYIKPSPTSETALVTPSKTIVRQFSLFFPCRRKFHDASELEGYDSAPYG